MSFAQALQSVLKSITPDVTGFFCILVISIPATFLTSFVCKLWWYRLSQLYRIDNPPEPFGRASSSVGFLERLLYAYAVLVGQYGLITSWIILKAFFQWIKWEDSPQVESAKADQTESPATTSTDAVVTTESSSSSPSLQKPTSALDRKQQTGWFTFHAYIGGSLISLMSGIAQGEFAVFVARVVRTWLSLSP